MNKSRWIIGVVALATVASSSMAQSPPSWTQVGMLNCTLAPSLGLIIGGQQRMSCRFTPNQPFPPPEGHAGVMTTIGLDIGGIAGGALAWAVFSPTVGLAPGSLAGTYVGASGDATFGVGVGANVLVGGSARSIALQPLSVEGSVGLNFQLGLSGLELMPAP